MEFSRQEYWSGFSFPSPGNLLDSGIEPISPALEGGFFTTEPPGRQNEKKKKEKKFALLVSDIDNVGGCACVRQRVNGKSLYLPLNFLTKLTATAAAKSLQSCPTLCDPIDGSPPGSPPLGFSRQEHWSGLPFPSPMHESEK